MMYRLFVNNPFSMVPMMFAICTQRSRDCRVPVCENKMDDKMDFSVMLYVKIVSAFNCVLMTFTARDLHCFFPQPVFSECIRCFVC